MDKRSNSNSSLTSSTSSGARSWADKVKGVEASHTTVSVEVLPRTGAFDEDGRYVITIAFYCYQCLHVV
jgi:hypothetical protein